MCTIVKTVLVLTLSVFSILVLIGGAVGKDVDPKKQVNKLITAIQNDDYETVFKMSFINVLMANKLKSETPDFMYQKKLNEYIEYSRKEFNENEKLSPYFPKDCVWKIIEVKKMKTVVPFVKGMIDAFHVYASITYKSMNTSPNYLISSSPDLFCPIKDAVIEFIILPNNGLYVGHNKMVEANVLWDMPIKISELKYEYGMNNNLPALLVNFSIDSGNPKWLNAKEPFKYTFFLNNEDIDHFLNKNPNYSKELQEINRKNKVLSLMVTKSDVFQRHSEGFEWPKNVSVPLNLKITITDSSSPSKVATSEIKIGPPPASEVPKEESPNEMRQEPANKPNKQRDKSMDKLRNIIGF